MPTPTYYFAHVIGHFVFDENFGVVDSGEEKIRKKYPNLIDITEQNISAYKQALVALKNPHYLPLFYEQNKAAVRRALRTIANNDNYIIQTIASMDEVTKARDMLMHRLGEWCSLFYPEISKTKDILSLAVTVDAKDAVPIRQLTAHINELSDLWNAQLAYLKKVMDGYCPNMAAVAGYELAGRLITISGSLEKLSRSTSSEIQVLGAEKAFFRHLMHQTPLPKHGIIVLHPLIKRADDAKKGKAARAIAEKISIAARVDYFKGEYIGDKLRKDLEAS
ncbi:hypothetical protein HY639_05265 [Candidatus Woesearchaeota archaeon]|nr:hypothetical protein [Candidatus Woesearchaeota archaeon]